MSSDTPEIGSKISLISKSNIRYEGELFTVDPQNCTVALSNVRSFGTEDRDSKTVVLPQSQTYEIILFRASDIKDIREIEVLPNDPAIVHQHISHAPPSATPGYPRVIQQPHSFPHHMTAAPGSHLMGGGLSGHLPGHVSIAPGGYNPMSGSVLDLMMGSLSRSSTPAPRKSPTSFDQGGGLHHNGNVIGNRDSRMGPMNRAVQRPQSRQSRSRERMNNQQHSSHHGSGQQNLTYRDRNDFYDRQEMRHEFKDYRDRDSHRDNRMDGGDRRGGGGGGRDNYRDRDNYRSNHQNHYSHQGRVGGGGGGWHNNQRQRSISGGRRPRPRSRGPGFGGGNRQGGYQGKKNTLTFDGDYDFDKANNEFNEMLTKMQEVKVGDDDAPPPVNGEVDAKKDDSGNETGVGENDPEEDPAKFYDKTKSFFDNISCEAVERSKGAFQRPDWRQERKMNSETFGVQATRRVGYRRGRGGGFFYPRGYNNRNYGNNQNNQRNNYHRNNQNNRQYQPRHNNPSNNSKNNSTSTEVTSAPPSNTAEAAK